VRKREKEGKKEREGGRKKEREGYNIKRTISERKMRLG
jgi:hypothetical protein